MTNFKRRSKTRLNKHRAKKMSRGRVGNRKNRWKSKKKQAGTRQKKRNKYAKFSAANKES